MFEYGISELDSVAGKYVILKPEGRVARQSERVKAPRHYARPPCSPTAVAAKQPR